MKCMLCSLEFDQSDALHSCKGCPMSGGCSRIKCPRCGYESPILPDWYENINDKIKKGWFHDYFRKITGNIRTLLDRK